MSSYQLLASLFSDYYKRQQVQTKPLAENILCSILSAFRKGISQAIIVSLESGLQASVSIFPLRGWMTRSALLNGGITKPACLGGTVCWPGPPSPPAWQPHKGHQGSTETAQSQGLSDKAWVDTRVEKVCVCVRVRLLVNLLTGQFQPVGPDGTVWPLISQVIVSLFLCKSTEQSHPTNFSFLNFSSYSTISSVTVLL